MVLIWTAYNLAAVLVAKVACWQTQTAAAVCADAVELGPAEFAGPAHYCVLSEFALQSLGMLPAALAAAAAVGAGCGSASSVAVAAAVQ